MWKDVFPPGLMARKEDCMETTNLPSQAIVTQGQLPGGIWFNSDHQWIYTDISLTHLIGLIPHKPKQREWRYLESENKKMWAEYIIKLKEKLTEDNVFDRVTQLWTKTIHGDVSDEDKKSMKNLTAPSQKECSLPKKSTKESN